MTNSKKDKSSSKLTSQQEKQLELGKHLQLFIETGYTNKKQLLLFSLLKGAATGVGGVIGATVVIALLLWVLSLFSQVPFVGNFTNSVENTIQQSKK